MIIVWNLVLPGVVDGVVVGGVVAVAPLAQAGVAPLLVEGAGHRTEWVSRGGGGEYLPPVYIELQFLSGVEFLSFGLCTNISYG